MNFLTTRHVDLSPFFNDVFFRDFFADDFFSPLPALKKIDYPVNIYENKKGLVIDIAAIGLEKSDIKIDIKDDILKVSHEKNNEIKTDNYAYKGITQKSFNLAWRINEKFDLAKTIASLEKGLLTITIPLADEKKSKEISVSIQ